MGQDFLDTQYTIEWERLRRASPPEKRRSYVFGLATATDPEFKAYALKVNTSQGSSFWPSKVCDTM